MFTAYRNFEQDIFVHHIDRKETLNLTGTGVTEANPVWYPDGKSVYFASNRTKPSYPTGMRDASIYRMALDYFDQPYRIDQFEKLFDKTQADKKDDTTKKKKEGRKEKRR